MVLDMMFNTNFSNWLLKLFPSFLFQAFSLPLPLSFHQKKKKNQTHKQNQKGNTLREWFSVQGEWKGKYLSLSLEELPVVGRAWARTVMEGETWGKSRSGPRAFQGLSHLAEDRVVWQGYSQSISLLEKEWGHEADEGGNTDLNFLPKDPIFSLRLKIK